MKRKKNAEGEDEVNNRRANDREAKKWKLDTEWKMEANEEEGKWEGENTEKAG